MIEQGVRAFTLIYLGLGSRFVINEALLLLFEIEVAPTRVIGTLVKTALYRARWNVNTQQKGEGTDHFLLDVVHILGLARLFQVGLCFPNSSFEILYFLSAGLFRALEIREFV